MLRWPSSVENTFHRSRDVLSQNRCVELSSRILVLRVLDSHIRTYHNGRELSGPAAGRLLLQPSQRHGRSPARPWLSDLSHSLNSSEGFRVQGRDRASIKPRHLGMCLCRLQWYWQEAPSSKRGGPIYPCHDDLWAQVIFPLSFYMLCGDVERLDFSDH